MSGVRPGCRQGRAALPIAEMSDSTWPGHGTIPERDVIDGENFAHSLIATEMGLVILLACCVLEAGSGLRVEVPSG